VVEDQCWERPVAGRLIGDRGDLYVFAVDCQRRHRAFLRRQGARHDKAERKKKETQFSAGVDHWCDLVERRQDCRYWALVLRVGQSNNA
jgi:hypothetical protein